MAIAMRTAVPIDLYCYADFDYTVIAVCCNNLPDNLPDKASPGETGSASRVTQTEIVY